MFSFYFSCVILVTTGALTQMCVGVMFLLLACVFQVYLILASQLLVTTGIVAIFTFV